MKVTIRPPIEIMVYGKHCEGCAIDGYCIITREKLKFLGGGGDGISYPLYERSQACLDAEKEVNDV